MISDFDAGVGTFKNTFNTVNTQVRQLARSRVAPAGSTPQRAARCRPPVASLHARALPRPAPAPQNLQGSLMALCDDPLAVSTGQAWVGVRPRVRVPIYITANDLTCLYAVSGAARTSLDAVPSPSGPPLRLSVAASVGLPALSTSKPPLGPLCGRGAALCHGQLHCLTQHASSRCCFCLDGTAAKHALAVRA